MVFSLITSFVDRALYLNHAGGNIPSHSASNRLPLRHHTEETITICKI